MQSSCSIDFDGTPILKLWLLASYSTVDETLPERRKAGSQLPLFCQRCVEIAPEKNEDLHCRLCAEWILEEKQPKPR